ncbi:hypothetical protein AVEN_24807-1 [Araneus ventricosus]|uniref:Uncharacterized protein n=1 Tax=Araneus ventricosus TaxID=182803 RepID=A0A4Y2BWC8_ARAVE|nr:hypothetical protein AVEN_24807-1 [Araneus ventricosus]
MQEKGENLMVQDLVCSSGDPISPIPGDECVLLCPLLCGVLHYRPKTKPINSRALVGTNDPSDFHLFPAMKSAISGRHFRTCSSN